MEDVGVSDPGERIVRSLDRRADKEQILLVSGVVYE